MAYLSDSNILQRKTNTEFEERDDLDLTKTDVVNADDLKEGDDLDLTETDVVNADDLKEGISDRLHYGITNGWQEGKTLQGCMLQMLEKEIMCDVTFILGEDRLKMKAHTYMLASRSPVFYSMFEKSCHEKGDVEVPDVDNKTFKCLLKYIYTDELDVTFDNVETMLYAAKKYTLTALEDECIYFLSKSLSSVNALRILDITTRLELDDLRETSVRHIKLHTNACLLASPHESISERCMKVILELNEINCGETELCRYFLRWAAAMCGIEGKEASGENIRTVAGNLLYLVRFPKVEKKYLAKDLGYSGIFSSEEVVDIFTAPYYEKTKTFSNKNRSHTLKHFELIRYGRITSRPCRLGDGRNEAIAFSTSLPIALSGVIMYGPTKDIEAEDSSIGVIVYNYNSDKIHEQTFYSELEPTELQQFKFRNALTILEDKEYSILITSPRYPTYTGKDCNASCYEGDVQVTFMPSKHNNSPTSTTKGQIAGIAFDALVSVSHR